MTTLEDTKQNRPTSNRPFSCNRKDLLENIAPQFEECKNLWAVVQDKHELYINKLDARDTDTENDQLKEVQDKFLQKIRHLKDIQQKIEKKTQEKEEKTHEKEAKTSQSQMKNKRTNSNT